jgi:acyl-CoA thioesterase
MSKDDDLEARIRSGKALFESMGGYHVTGWDAAKKEVTSAFTVRREYCHTNGTIAQGGFITAWLDAAMAHAVLHDSDHTLNVASLEIKVSFLERVGPGLGVAHGRVVRRGKRVAFMEGDLYNADGKLAAQATSTGMLVPVHPSAAAMKAT